MKLQLAKLLTDAGTQSRAEIDPFVAGEYAKALKAGAKFPSVDVFTDGKSIWLADGFHRHRAHEIAGRHEIEVKRHRGSLDDAVLFAAKSNQTHGVRRTNADKRRSVEILLQRETWRARTDRWIADEAGVGHPLVSEVRKLLEESSNTRRKGADGKTYSARRASLPSRIVELLRDTDFADDRGALAELAKLAEDEQLAAAQLLAGGGAISVHEAIKKIRRAERRTNDAYYTPPELALELTRRVATFAKPPTAVLEPSSGGGAFLTAVRSVFTGVQLAAVDIDPAAEAVSKTGGADHFWNTDFLKWKTPRRFDLILGNPPYMENLPQLHVQRALKLLNPGGVVAFLLRLSFLATADRVELNAGPGRYLAPVVPRPSFTGDGDTDNSEYGLFAFVKDGTHGIPIGDPIVWKPAKKKAGAKP